MKQCWPEGDLRAYLDGEAPADVRERIAAHLAVCSACDARRHELSERAAWVSNLMAMLPSTEPVGALRIAPAPVGHGRRWAMAGLAMAAGLAIAFAMLPRHGNAPVAVVAPPAPAVVPVAVEPPVVVKPAVMRQHVARQRPAVLRADFLRLDDEPIETGTVVRVSAENGDVQADLIVGPDGRAHAIRMIGN